MLRKIKRTKMVKDIRSRLPENLRIFVGDIGRWWGYVFYRRFFKKKFLALFPAIRYLFRGYKKEKRILGIWNFAVTPPTIGVFLEFEMRLLCMSYLNNSCKIDLAFVYDSNKSVVGPKYESWVNASNFQYHFGEMYPMVNILPRLGSVFLFDSHDKFESYYLDNEDKYIAHSTFFEYVNDANSRPNIPFVRDFYLQEKFIPKFEFKTATINWARAFVKKHIGDNYMIVVSLRHNHAYSSHRNSALDEWKKFFEHCLDKKQGIVFVVLGRQNEVKGIKNVLGDLPNVTYSLVENPNIEQNLALIELSLMYMATVFGPASLPTLTNYIPFIVTNYENPEREYDYKWLKKGGQYPWQNLETQCLVWERENADILIKKFEDIFSKVDKEGWKRKLNLMEVEESSLEWPYN